MEKHLNDDMGEYHDPQLRLEHIKIAYERAIKLHNLTAKIMQSIIAESPYKTLDMEWHVWHRARILSDENALPDGITADDLMQTYYSIFEREDRGL